MKPSIQSLRYIDDGTDLSSSEGLAADEALCHSVAAGKAPPTIHLYTYRPAVIVGRYQNLTDAIDLEACRRYGYEWNRRHTGGGTVMMGPEQLAVGLVLPDEGSSISSIRSHFTYFAGVLSKALGKFDVEAGFSGKNDLVINGRKVAGLAISQDTDGVVFFHCSLIWDFDVKIMVDILNLSTRDLDDRGHSCFAQRMTTVREHAPDVTISALKEALVAELECRHDVACTHAGWNEGEGETTASLRLRRYDRDEWIYSDRVLKRWTGSSERKTEGGILRIYVDRVGGVLDSVLITGDYFSRGLEVAALESALRGIACKREQILDVISHSSGDLIYRVDAEALTDLILTASRNTGPRFLAELGR